MEHDCTMKDELTGMVKSLQNSVKWTLGICAGAIVLLLVGYGTLAKGQDTNRIAIDRINNDYLPYFAFEYIVESNNKLINILTAIDSKDEARYKEALQDWSHLQQEVIKQAGLNKKRGYEKGPK